MGINIVVIIKIARKTDRERCLVINSSLGLLDLGSLETWYTQLYSRRYNKDVVNGSSCVYDAKKLFSFSFNWLLF